MGFVRDHEAEIKLLVRLVDDADLLLRSERYDSSLILSVIAAENIGKLMMHRWKLPGVNNHRQRQKIAASLMMSHLFLDGVETAGFAFKKIEDLTPDQKAFLEQVDSSDESKSQWRERTIKLMADGVAAWPHNKVLDAIHTGWVYDVRNNAIYGNDPSRFSAEEIQSAAIALNEMCKRLLPWLKNSADSI